MFAIYDDPLAIMDDREKDDPGYIEHDGPFRGIVIRPHSKCESIRLDFSVSNEFAAFTKTQFAPFATHAEIIELFHAIEPYMAEFLVTDESGLWETGNEAEARRRFNSLGAAIEDLADDLRTGAADVEGPGLLLDEATDGCQPEEEPYG
jgi:hypothetical protein